jgi:hypothetical protein
MSSSASRSACRGRIAARHRAWRTCCATAGLGAGQSLALVGWKYLETDEWTGSLPGFFAPAMLVDTLRDLAGDPAAVRDATPALLHPVDGLRANVEVEQIAAFEWAAARATAAVGRIQRGLRPDLSELEAVGSMGYEGDPLSTHILFASGTDRIVGLGSPGTRRIARGDAVTCGFASGVASAPAPGSWTTTTGSSSTSSRSPTSVASSPGTRWSASAWRAASSTSG